MASVVTGLNLVNGQEISLPYEVTGTCTGTGTNLIAAARQIDDLPSIDLGVDCVPQLPDNPNPATVDFAFVLTSFDAPNPDTYYMLTLLFWDESATPLTVTSVTFKTPAFVPPPPPPPKGR